MGLFEILGVLADAIVEAETREPTTPVVVQQPAQPDVVIVRQTPASHPSACAAIRVIAANVADATFDSDRESAAYEIRKVVIANNFAEDVSATAVEELAKLSERCHFRSSKDAILRQIKRIGKKER